MRIAVIADIHGNLPALEAVLSDLERRPIDKLVIAGDMVSGPQPQAVVGCLRDKEAVMIRGNHEGYALDRGRGLTPTGNGSSRQWEAMEWSYARLGRDVLDFLAALLEQHVITAGGIAQIRVVHGSPKSNREHILPDRSPAALIRFRQADMLPWEQTPPPLGLITESIGEAVLVCAHSHIPWQQSEDGCLVVNPGSAGMSVNGDPRATYATLTWTGRLWRAEHHFVTYDVERLRSIYEASGFLVDGGAFARACLLCSESGHNVALRLVLHVARVAAAQGLDTTGGISNDVWDAAIADFDWARAVQSGGPDDRPWR